MDLTIDVLRIFNFILTYQSWIDNNGTSSKSFHYSDNTDHIFTKGLIMYIIKIKLDIRNALSLFSYILCSAYLNIV